MQPKADFVRAMFARIAHCYDFMNRLMTLGRDRAWRRYVAQQTDLPQGGLALDVATGTADLALALARRYPHGRVVGVDFCPEMMELGWAKVAAAEENPRVRFVTGDALGLPFADGCFDAVTSGFALRNLADIPQAFAEMGRVVKLGGRVVCLEIARPTLPVFRHLFHLYFYRLVPLLGRVVAGQGEAYHYLPNTLTHFLSPEELKAVMEGAGLSQVWYRRLMLGTVAVHVGFKGAGVSKHEWHEGTKGTNLREIRPFVFFVIRNLCAHYTLARGISQNRWRMRCCLSLRATEELALSPALSKVEGEAEGERSNLLTSSEIASSLRSSQ